MLTDYYKILDVSRNAPQDAIRKAYLAKAKKHHPDVSSSIGAKNDFQLINEAYQTLIDPDKRKWYDFKLQYPTTTGLYATQRGNPRDAKSRYASYYAAYQRSQNQAAQDKEEHKYIKTYLDKVLFYFLIVCGFLALIFGIIRLLTEKYEGISDLSGIVFGTWFILLLLYGWNKLSK